MLIRLNTDNGHHLLVVNAGGAEESFHLRKGVSREVAKRVANDVRLPRILAAWGRDPGSEDMFVLAALAVMEPTLVVGQEHHGVEPLFADERLP